MAGETIAVEFAGHVVTTLADHVASFIEKQINYQMRAKRLLETLKEDLKKIQATIYSACMLQINNPALQRWLSELMVAAGAAQNVLKKAPGTFEPRLSLKRFLFKDQDLNELHDVVKRFQNIAAEMGNFLKLVELDLVARKHREMLGSRQTTSMPIESHIIGRDKERNDMLNFLLATGNNFVCGNDEKLAVISIVGIHGIGKTTLARCVYNDRNIREHFDIKVWLCASEELNVKRLMIEIIESASIQRPHDLHRLINLDTIQGIFKQVLMDKRFLIVFDDIRSDQIIAAWDTLGPPFKFGKKGSRIILTTRDQSIGEMMEMKTVNLSGIEGEDCRRLFTQWASSGANPIDPRMVEWAGRQIAPMLGGSPWAAKTMAHKMASSLRQEQGQKVMKSKL